MSTGGNHRSHCASSPGAYEVRDAGSGGRNSGRNCATRARSTVIAPVQPTLSAITVAGMSGNCCSSDRIRGSNTSTVDPRGSREYFGGPCDANARRTAFLEMPRRRTIALIGKPSTRCKLRISAQSSTFITPQSLRRGSTFAHRQGVSFHSSSTLSKNHLLWRGTAECTGR